MSSATVGGATVANFIRDNFICQFIILYCLLSDNRTSYVNVHVRKLLNDYRIDDLKSNPYYAQGNGQAEAKKKTLLYILNRMISEEPKNGQNISH